MSVAAAAVSAMLLTGCMPMLDTSMSVSPAPGVNIGVSSSTPIGSWWGDGPFWGNGIAGVPAWGAYPPYQPPVIVNRPVIVERPQPQPSGRPVTLPARPVVPSEGQIRPYPTGPGPVVGGTGLPNLRPGANVPASGGSHAATPPSGGGSFRPYLRK